MFKKGHLVSKKIRKKMSNSKKGEKNPRWDNGSSEYPDHAELKRARIKVLKRSKNKCEICGKQAVIVHHIDGDKSNHNIDNLIAVCLECHEPLHCDDTGKSFKGRPTKYGIIYGMTLKEIAIRFGVSYGTIYNWNNNPKKKKWLEEKLSEYKT
ncbi:hypothetical protein ES705_30620 [subsurface metagenome]